jgi:hypothetical protein
VPSNANLNERWRDIYVTLRFLSVAFTHLFGEIALRAPAWEFLNETINLSVCNREMDRYDHGSLRDALFPRSSRSRDWLIIHRDARPGVSLVSALDRYATTFLYRKEKWEKMVEVARSMIYLRFNEAQQLVVSLSLSLSLSLSIHVVARSRNHSIDLAFRICDERHNAAMMRAVV